MPNIVDSDFTVTFVIEDEDGNPQDVSGWTFETRWYRERTRELAHTLTDGVEFVSDGSDGQCNLVLTAAQSKTLGGGNARVVIWRTDSGNRLVIAEGSANFELLEAN
jgi:hypothetical protein